MINHESGPKVPAPGEGKRGEQGYLGYLLMQASAANRHRMERLMGDIGVTPPQFLVLTMVGAYPGLSNADLARLCALTPQTVNVVVARLESDGAITRRPHAVHRRIRMIELTRQGEALLAECRPRARTIDQELLHGLSEHDEQVIRRWLVRIAVMNGEEK